MRADEALRNDPKARAAAREKILKEADEVDQVTVLLQQVLDVTKGWTDSDFPGMGSILGRVRKTLWEASYRLPPSEQLRKNAESETYVGNMAAFGNRH